MFLHFIPSVCDEMSCLCLRPPSSSVLAQSELISRLLQHYLLLSFSFLVSTMSILCVS